MTHKQSDASAGGFRLPPVQPGLFDLVEKGRLLEDELRAKAGRLERSRRFEILFDTLEDRTGLKERVVRVLDRVKGDDDAFAVTLDNIAYARRCDAGQQPAVALAGTVGKLEGCVENGIMPVRQMRELLEAGISLDKTFFSYHDGKYLFNDAGIAAERNWVNGWDKRPEKWMHIEFPPRDGLVDELHDMGQSTIHDWRTSSEVPLESAEERVLHAVYADRLRARRADERRKERFLTTDDW
jgi:hypothetical protein